MKWRSKKIDFPIMKFIFVPLIFAVITYAVAVPVYINAVLPFIEEIV